MYKLAPRPVFDNIAHSWTGLSIAPASIGELISISSRLGQEADLGKNFKKAHGTTLPSPTKWIKFDQGHIGWLGPDQYLAEIDHTDEYIDQNAATALGGSASVTLQSDAWVGLDISGERVAELLERLIALDTSDTAFPAGSMARTQMHHLGVILLRYPDTQNIYRILSARSSAQYFLHAVTQTAQNICGDPV